MNRDSTSHTVLALESAIRGGSIALFRDDKEIASAGGNNDVSRAEDLLPNIEKLFNDTGIKFDEIDLIAVSRGPGSYTGIRIGIATALGLARALNISCAGVSVLKAMTILGDRSRKFITAVPFSKSEVVWQAFGLYEETHHETFSSENVVTVEDFYASVESMNTETIILHGDLFQNLTDRSIKISGDVQVLTAGRVLASIIGRFAKQSAPSIPDLSPIYSLNPSKNRGLF